MSKDVLVSIARIREGIAAVEDEVERQRKLRAAGDPFFLHVAWVLTEVRAAIHDAQVEYVPTGEAADLTGWSDETLRRHAKALHAGEAAPREWGQMLVRKDGGDWAFCVSTIPVKRAVAA
jgi:hypothetical protein